VIAIADYGMGNLRSVEKAFRYLGFPASVSESPMAVRSASAVVLPGVGAFAGAMNNLRRRNLDAAILDAIREGKPFLGICLGLQLLFHESEEFGPSKGLGVLPGRVVRFAGEQFAHGGLKVPHMGWNSIRLRRPSPFFEGVADGAMMYFVHGYFPVPTQEEIVVASCTHGIEFACAVQKGNMFACQFHPEKSAEAGLKILENFGRAVYGESSSVALEAAETRRLGTGDPSRRRPILRRNGWK
jgi:glutamine amidotransferase